MRIDVIFGKWATCSAGKYDETEWIIPRVYPQNPFTEPPGEKWKTPLLRFLEEGSHWFLEAGNVLVHLRSVSDAIFI
jgi:hypothetical protein